MLDDAGILVPLSWPTPHSSTTISVAQTKPELINEQHGDPVSNSPADVILNPDQSSLPLFLSEWNTNVGSGARIDVMESVPHSLDADTGSLSGVQKVKQRV
jgi:hypothetical protein